MTNLPPPPLPPPPLGNARAPRARRWVLAATIAAVALAGVVVITTLTKPGEDHPKEWDPRVASIAEFVEGERDLMFDHAVHVDFLTAEEYTELSTATNGDDNRNALDRYAAELRALGVASGAVDLVTAFDEMADGGSLAFYDPRTKRISVRGTTMTAGLQVTLAHELTHALQDQHFDLDQVADPDGDSSAATVFRALVEGDAMRVESAYRSTQLTPDELDAYEKEYERELSTSGAATADVPAFLRGATGAPYALGQPFVVMLFNQGGNTAVDSALNEPPRTEEAIFDPSSYLNGEGEKPLDLGFDEDVELFDTDPFGATSWYFILAERIDPKVAFEAARGWNGDDFAAFERDGITCVRLGFIGDQRRDEREMADAIDEWVEAMPGGEARRRNIDGHPGIEACDPGEDLDMALTGRSETSITLPSLWGFLVADVAAALGADGTRCYAREVVDHLTYEQITDPEGDTMNGDAFQDVLRDAFTTCEAGQASSLSVLQSRSPLR
ncbi:MAG: hypothetical protein EXQ71_05000 [Acidimicrobiia bacterium]|nr:hypothetical protein [Acidimicrobiia bacterium]